MVLAGITTSTIGCCSMHTFIDVKDGIAITVARPGSSGVAVDWKAMLTVQKTKPFNRHREATSLRCRRVYHTQL